MGIPVQLQFLQVDKTLKLQRYLYKPLAVRQGMEFAAFFPGGMRSISPSAALSSLLH